MATIRNRNGKWQAQVPFAVGDLRPCGLAQTMLASTSLPDTPPSRDRIRRCQLSAPQAERCHCEGFPIGHSLFQPDPLDAKNCDATGHNDDLLMNDGGSGDVWFGPKVPEGKMSNWVLTVSGQTWNAIQRLYGPLAPCCDRS